MKIITIRLYTSIKPTHLFSSWVQLFTLVPTCSLSDVTDSLDGVVLSRTWGCHVNFVINIPDNPLSGRLLTTKKTLSASVMLRGI